MRLAQVISGGQDGVDVAALRAARASGLRTGGMMPRDFMTHTGPKPEYADLYGVRASPSRSWAARTFVNVADAHVTLRLASKWDSAGESCTLRAIRDAGRDHLDVTLLAPRASAGGWTSSASTGNVALWILGLSGNVVLNVAGNSERTAPGIELAAETFLREVFLDVAAA